jgi:hypothetical protein
MRNILLAVTVLFAMTASVSMTDAREFTQQPGDFYGLRASSRYLYLPAGFYQRRYPYRQCYLIDTFSGRCIEWYDPSSAP